MSGVRPGHVPADIMIHPVVQPLAPNHRAAVDQGLTLVHIRAQFEQLQDTFMS